jgi:iron complex outermembrane receptor protein
MNQNNMRLVRAVRRALSGNHILAVHTGAAACAGMLFAMGTGVAAAADAPTGTLAEITVTGIRASIVSAIAAKEQSDNIVETISAEDLGKLPDLSIADSLARLPGLAAQRTDGRSNYISIRGFAPDFSGTTLSGREQASTGENRGVEFDQYPAELINSVEVYKTPDASLIGQGLAGTVNLNTIRPLSFNESKMAFNARAERNSYTDLNPGQGVGTTGSRFSFSLVDQFFDHTLGAAFGAARLDSPVQEKQYQAWWWGVNNGPPGSNSFQGQGWSGPVVGDPNFAVSQEGMQIRAKSEAQVRTGLMGVLEWAPTDSYHSQLDLFYSKFNQDSSLNGLQWSTSPWDGINYTNAQTTPQGSSSILTRGTLNNVKPIMQNEFTNTGTNNFSAGWNNRVNFGNGWTAIADLSYSSAKDTVHDAYAFTGAQSVFVNGIGFQIPIGGGYPGFAVPIDLTSPSVVGFTDPAGYGYNGRAEWDHQTDTIKAVRLDVKHSLGWIFKSVDVGFDYSDRKKVKSAVVDFAFLNGNGCSTTNQPSCAKYDNTLYATINPAALYAPTSLSYAGVPGAANYNVLSAINRQFYLTADMGGNDYNRNYAIEEKVPLAYVKFDIDTDLGSVPLRGNVGVQWVHTNQSSTAQVTDPNSGQPNGSVTAGTSYNELLPSLNLVGNIGHRNYLRLGVSKSMMRGRIDDEKAAASAGVATTGPALWSGSGGNPHLKPYIAIGEDLSFEKVFGEASYFSVALFNKNLTSYIFSQTVPYDFTGYKSAARQPLSNFGTFSTPANGSGGKIQGYELALVVEGKLLSPALDGFGILSNFAYTNNFIATKLLGNVPGGPTTFPGFSKKVGALTLYYEKYGASVRIAETYRSQFTGEIIARFDQLGYTQIKTDKTTNLQAGYEFKDGSYKGLSILLQVNNLTNSPYGTVQISSLTDGTVYTTPLENDTFGRAILLGVNYKR